MTHSKRKRLIKTRRSKTGEGHQAAQEAELGKRRKAWEARKRLLPLGDGAIFSSEPPRPAAEPLVRRIGGSDNVDWMPPVIPEPPKTEASVTGPTLPEHFEKLGGLRHSGDTVEQQVLIGPWRVSYMLGNDYEPVSVTIGGAGDWPMPEWLFPTARLYRDIHKSEILDMLNAARHGDFHADRDGIAATFKTPMGEVGAWYTSWDDERPIVRWASGVEYEVAQNYAREKFLEVPEEVRKRLFSVARPWEADDDSAA
jgi:hypothetical protein